MKLPNLATDENRWIALVFLALSLAIVIIDNNVLTVAIPYILRDLHTTFDAIQWVISGYALIIASILITVGRIGDLFGRKKLFLLGTGLFAIGSFIASVSVNALMLFIGEALIEAVGAAMMLTSSLSLLVTEFRGKERAIAFGIWGSVAGASASIGPLLGGFLTTYYSWRWSLRINVFIAIIAIAGSVFIQEAYGKKTEKFDWTGTFYSCIGLFLLVFGFIEGRNFGWFYAVHPLAGTLFAMLGGLSFIPFVFILSALFLGLFVWREYHFEKSGGEPLLRLSLFKNKGFSMGLAALGILIMGQFGSFFIFPLYYQNVLGLSAFQTGLIFLWTSITIAIAGPLSGWLAVRFRPKWVVVAGMMSSFASFLWISTMLSTHLNTIMIGPPLILLGIGIGLASSQVVNIILSHVPQEFSGEASAVNATIRQVGASIGTALIGTILAMNLSSNIVQIVNSDATFPISIRQQLAERVKNVNAESGQQALHQTLPNKPVCLSDTAKCFSPQQIFISVKKDMDQALVEGAKAAFHMGLVFIGIGIICAFFIPNDKIEEKKRAGTT